ncbi:amidohydrolase family protein [Afipia massiliensis]|uniref:Amidohydrolase family protein n=2 Tax=Afipia massiliensis TaxID=211460 RepID=A0A4U6BUQ4_9BRAD|nr:amidohydrolase family protein [Afipia massiliensis]
MRICLGHFSRIALGWVLVAFASPVAAQQGAPSETLFRNVRVLDVLKGELGPATDVLVRGNRVAAIGASGKAAAGATVIDGQGRTLMPGLIDVHVHISFGSLLFPQLNDPKTSPEKLGTAMSNSAEQMLLRGFTAVRDMGGPIFPLKRAIDAGKTLGPRIWPSGAVVSQTSGHGDFRAPSERSRRFFGKPSRAEEYGATFIADGRDEVLTATRENLRMGASQIKLMAGGGTSSAYDPIDVTQYTSDEMKAAVEAADDWNTYVAVHAYTPRAVRRAIDAGVKCIEHGQLLDEPTIELMARRGIWLSAQNLIPDSPNMTPERRKKRADIIEGNARLWPMAKKHGVKLAWGTDLLFEPELNAQQNALILALRQWFTPAEVLKMVTYDNAQLLALSGPRTPYEGKLGIVEEGALADLILVNGDPLAKLDLIADPGKNFSVIMKDGVIYKGAQR